jgi:hypothetical protein
MNRQKTGDYGERLAMERLGAYAPTLVSDTAPYDILVGDNIKIEVKTAHKSKRGYYKFALYKKNHADHRHSDIIILQCIMDDNSVVAFIVPTRILYHVKHFAITSSPTTYSGVLSKYRVIENYNNLLVYDSATVIYITRE